MAEYTKAGAVPGAVRIALDQLVKRATEFSHGPTSSNEMELEVAMVRTREELELWCGKHPEALLQRSA